MSGQISLSTIEIVWLIFVLYFWSTTLQSLIQSKILYLLRAKKQDPNAIIGGILLWLMSIVVLYTTISFTIAYIIGDGVSIINITSRIGLTTVLCITTMIVVLFSLVSNTYIAFMSWLIIYGISYSINFLVESMSILWPQSVNAKILNIMKYIFPRYDLLTTNLLPLSNWIRVIIGHIVYMVTLYIIINKVFSSRYTSHENLLKLWHQSKKQKASSTIW